MRSCISGPRLAVTWRLQPGKFSGRPEADNQPTNLIGVTSRYLERPLDRASSRRGATTAATDGRLRERRIDDATIALQIDDEESFRGKKPGRTAGRSALLLRVLAALLTAALLGAIVLYSQRPGLAPAAPPLDFEPL